MKRLQKKYPLHQFKQALCQTFKPSLPVVHNHVFTQKFW